MLSSSDELAKALERHDFDYDLQPGEEAQITVTYEDHRALRAALAKIIPK